MKHWEKELKDFINRHYALEVIKGLVFFSLWTLLVWVIIGYLGWWWREDRQLRTVLFFGSLISLMWIAWRYWLPAALAWSGLMKRMTDLDAAGRLKKWLPEIDDRVVNAIQFRNEAEKRKGLWLDALEQRDRELQNIRLRSARPWEELRPFLFLLVVPLALLGALKLSGELDRISEGTKNVIAFSKELDPRYAFSWEWVEQPPNEIEEGTRLEMRAVAGSGQRAEAAFVELNGMRSAMKWDGRSWYWKSPPIEEDAQMMVSGSEGKPLLFAIKVLGKPEILDARLRIDYPSYTGLPSEERAFEQRIKVPRGTRLTAEWRVKNVRGMSVSDKELVKQDGRYIGDYVVREGRTQHILVKNLSSNWKEWAVWQWDVLEDRPPVVEEDWSWSDSAVALKAVITDDFGIGGVDLLVHQRTGTTKISLDCNDQSDCVLSWSAGVTEMLSDYPDIKGLQIIARDNDSESGFNVTKGAYQAWRIKSEEEQIQESLQSLAAVGESMSAQNKREEQQRESADEAITESRTSEGDWKEKTRLKTQVEQLLQGNKLRTARRNKREEILNEWGERMPDNADVEELKERLKELKKKQERNAEALEKLLDDFEKGKKEDLLKRLEQARKNSQSEALSEERMEELMKREEVEMRFEQALNKLEDIQEEQKELSEKKKLNAEDSQKQEDLANKLNEWNKDYEEMLERNESLKEPMDIGEMDGEREEAESEMNEAKEAVEQSSSSEERMKEQSESAEKLQELLDQMQSMSAGMGANQQMENIETLRQIQDNLLVFSDGEELLAETLREMRQGDPSLKNKQADQQRLRAGSEVIKDSLRALAMRVPQISETVFDKLDQMDKASLFAQQAMGEQQLPKASSQSQYAMTAANELALMLDKTMQNMQMQMASAMPGSQNCNKPGGQSPSPSSMSKMQQKLMEGMQKGMGQKPGEQKGDKGKKTKGKGEGQGKGEGGLSPEEFADLLQKQEALREMWKALQEQNEKGAGGVGQDEVERLMEESERELAEMRLTPKSMERQREIESRLLEAEKAERDRGKEEKRQSSSGENKMRFDEGNERTEDDSREPETERIRYQPLRYNDYYQEMIDAVKQPG